LGPSGPFIPSGAGAWQNGSPGDKFVVLILGPKQPMRSAQVELGDITLLLQRWSDGDRAALDKLMPLMYERLQRLAHERLRDERHALSVETTALVHDAYLKMVDLRRARFQDRAHFMAMASRIMRRILVDRARARRAEKRGGGAAPIELTDELQISDDRAEALTDLDDALERLAAVDPRRSQILEHRYFAGLSLEETAEVLGVSLATVKRDLRFARAWLAAEFKGEVRL
jgi:RNA polymerase sigma factor (TIGR02999 family)